MVARGGVARNMGGIAANGMRGERRRRASGGRVPDSRVLDWMVVPCKGKADKPKAGGRFPCTSFKTSKASRIHVVSLVPQSRSRYLGGLENGNMEAVGNR